jgi:hypothetical protein
VLTHRLHTFRYEFHRQKDEPLRVEQMSENFLCVAIKHATSASDDRECSVDRTSSHRSLLSDERTKSNAGPLAQWLVQETHNLLVASSSLARPTTFSMSLCQNR